MRYPRRALACKECKSRKLGCDGTTPACKRCQARKIRCSGPQSQQKFVSYEPKDASAKDGVTKQAVVLSKQPARHTQSVALPPSLQETWARVARSVMGTACSSTLGDAKPLSPHVGTFKGALERNPNVKSLDSALSALALISFDPGDAQVRHAMKHEAVKLYGHALKSTQEEISDSSALVHDDTLLAIRALADFDSSRLQMTSYDIHCSGMARLMKFKGPKQMMTKKALSVFIAIRNQLILCACMRNDEALPFDRQKDGWFFSIGEVTGNPWDKLQSIAATIPALREKGVQLPSMSIPAIRALKLACAQQYFALESWRHSLPIDSNPVALGKYTLPWTPKAGIEFDNLTTNLMLMSMYAYESVTLNITIRCWEQECCRLTKELLTPEEGSGELYSRESTTTHFNDAVNNFCAVASRYSRHGTNFIEDGQPTNFTAIHNHYYIMSPAYCVARLLKTSDPRKAWLSEKIYNLSGTTTMSLHDMYKSLADDDDFAVQQNYVEVHS